MSVLLIIIALVFNSSNVKLDQSSRSLELLCSWVSREFFVFIFMSLLTGTIFENQHLFAGMYFLFLKTRPKTKLKCFEY